MNATENIEGYLIKVCKNCQQKFKTKEQRKKYCSGKCKTQFSRQQITH